MAMRIKSHVYTVIFSIILILLKNLSSIAAQQQQQQQQQHQQQQQQTKDQNFYFQSPQRFQQPFPASRNGFFPTNVVPQSIPRSQLGAGIQQPLPPLPHQQQQQHQQHHDESAFFGAIPTKNDGPSSDYFQYSAFPQSPRQPENFFQISPRPFAIQPNGQHGVQFVRPPIVPQPQQYSAEQNNGNYPFSQHIGQQRPQLLHPDGSGLTQHQPIHQQQTIGHQNAPVSRAPTLTVYDATKFVKQAQASRLLNESTANRSSNSNSIRNSVRKSNESVTSQESSGSSSGGGGGGGITINSNTNNENNRFPNTRNRFHPLSTTKPSALNSQRTMQSLLTTAVESTTSPKQPQPNDNSNPSNGLDQRQNRIPISTRFGTSREQNTSVRINKFLRQPIYSSRETINQQPNNNNNSKRINVTHNGSSNRDVGSASASASQEVTNRTHQLQLLQQARQKIRESSVETAKVPVIPLNQGATAKPSQQKQTIAENQPSVEMVDDGDVNAGDEEFFYEDEVIDGKADENLGQIEVKTTIKPAADNKPVILTSNFFLPGKPIPNLQQNHDFENQQPNDLSSDLGEVNSPDKDNAEDVIDGEEVEEAEEDEQETERAAALETTKKPIEPTPQKSTSPSTTSNAKPTPDDPNVEYEYEYVDYDETTTEAQAKSQAKPTVEEHEHTTLHTFARDGADTTDQLAETDAPKKSDPKSIKSNANEDEQIEASIGPVETSSVSTTETAENTVETTEGYVVVASVQTSRSISGARYLTFPQVEQEEKKQLLSEIKEGKPKGKDKDEDYHNDDVHKYTDDGDETIHPNDDDDLVKSHEHESSTTANDENATETSDENTPHDADATARPDVSKNKTHKLSSISEKLAHLHELNEPKPDVTTKSVPVVIRKFSPRTTKAPTRKPHTTTSKRPYLGDDTDEHLASLLPPGFKYRANSFKETTITTSSTTPKLDITSISTEDNDDGVTVNANDNDNDKKALEIAGKRIPFKEISLDVLLPKDYKPVAGESQSKSMNLSNSGDEPNVLPKIKLNDNIEALLPKDFKLSASPSAAATTKSTLETTKAPFRLSTVTEDVSKFLPPGFKLGGYKDAATTKRPLPKTTMDDISKFLPPGYKLYKSTTTEMPADTKTDNGTAASIDSVLNKLSFNTDISSLIPPGFKSNLSADTEEKGVETTEKPPSSTTSSSFKVVFPKALGKRPGVRLTTPKPVHNEGPTPPGVTIRKGLPTRATTEFTGWPTVSTTPLSIEKLLQAQGVESIDISEILGKTSSSTSTTVVTTTTTTTTVRPTQPGLCHVQCDLAGTIKIVDGVKWKPELLDHNTVEWKNLAKEVEKQLNDVYSKADRLKKWYKKIRIDSFSQGSVLVDYFVELAEVSRDINTQEIKQMFHSALTEVPMTVVPLKNTNATTATSNLEQIISDFPDNVKPARSNYLMGDFILDPVATDFIVIPKQRVAPTTQNEIEQNSIIPQWAIAVIVIGAGSLLFVVIFGAAVLLNRQKRSKKKAPVPLTADMLNELNKNHMGGFENYGNEELYIEDTWDDVKPDFKPKRFANSSSDRDDRFDSWRTQQKYQASADYYYDQKLSKPHYSQKPYAYQAPAPAQTDPYLDNYHPHYHPSYSNHQHAHQNAMGLYTYNNRRYNRDYDPDF